MSAGGPSDRELEAAVEALGQSDRLREAEGLVARAAPQLQRILAQALESGGWFAESHEDELRKALELSEPERTMALRTLLAEETRMGMMVGVAVGWALAGELEAIPPNQSDRED
jgi:hypothetical protein